MATRWDPCRAVVNIEGRGPVRCWLPPAPGSPWCPAHAASGRAQSEDVASPADDRTAPRRRLLDPAKQLQSDCPVCRRSLSGAASVLFAGDRVIHALCWRDSTEPPASGEETP